MSSRRAKENRKETPRENPPDAPRPGFKYWLPLLLYYTGARLEEMAQLLYAEWFVKFKFPGHEKVKMIDSKTEYGLIPEALRIVKLGDKVRVFKGRNITRKTLS